MHLSLGNLSIVPAIDHPELVADPVMKTLLLLPNADAVGVTEIDSALSDTVAFCAEYTVRADQAANCIVLEVKDTGQPTFAACVVLGSTKADVNGIARRTLGARKVSFAPMVQAVAQTAMEPGAITPVGLPSDWPILVDKAVVDSDLLIIGSGIRKSKLVVSGSFFATLPNVQIVEGLGKAAS